MSLHLCGMLVLQASSLHAITQHRPPEPANLNWDFFAVLGLGTYPSNALEARPTEVNLYLKYLSYAIEAKLRTWNLPSLSPHAFYQFHWRKLLKKCFPKGNVFTFPSLAVPPINAPTLVGIELLLYWPASCFSKYGSHLWSSFLCVKSLCNKINHIPICGYRHHVFTGQYYNSARGISGLNAIVTLVKAKFSPNWVFNPNNNNNNNSPSTMAQWLNRHL